MGRLLRKSGTTVQCKGCNRASTVFRVADTRYRCSACNLEADFDAGAGSKYHYLPVKPSVAACAYAAAMFEMKGSLCILPGSSGHNTRPRLMFTAGKRDPAPLAFIRDSFQCGSLHNRRARPYAVVAFGMGAKTCVQNPTTELVIDGWARVDNFLKCIGPYLTGRTQDRILAIFAKHGASLMEEGGND